MSVRVNLLQAHEIQHQAAVSRGFLVRGGTLLGIGVAVLGTAFALFQYQQARSTHKRLKARWAAIEATYNEVKQTADKHAENQNYVAELDAWGSSRVEWNEPLNALQGLVPENIQFTRLTIESEVVLSEKEPATKEYVGTPARSYAFGIEGRAQGRLSDQDVIAFVETIRESPQFSPWLGSVRLQGMKRELVQAGEEQGARLFRVNGTSQERILK